MNKEEEFKESLQEILSSKEFAFDEAHWNAASDYIANARKKKRRALYFIIPALLLITGGLALYFYNSNNGTLTDKTISQNVPALKTNDSAFDNIRTELPEKAQTKEPSDINEKPSLPETPNATEPASAVSPAKKITKPVSSSPLINSNSAESQIVKHAVKTPVVKNPVAIVPNIVPVTVVVPVSSTTVSNSSSSNTSPKNEGNTPLSEETKSSVVTSPNSSTSATSEPLSEKTETIAQNPPVTEVKSPEPLPLAPTETSLATTPSVAAVLPAKADSTATPAINTPSTEARFFLFAEGGLSYAYGYKNPGFRDGNGFNPTVGLFGSTALTSKLSVGLGIQYNQVSQMEYSTKISKVTSYRFTEESDVMAITPQKMYYATFPIKISYTLNKDNLFGLGYNIGYLINTSSKVETYHQGINNTTNYTVSRSMGYTEGLKTFDKQLAFFYRRRMANNFWVNAEFFFGLTDIKDNTFFKSDVKEKNSGIKLTLMYNFYRK